MTYAEVVRAHASHAKALYGSKWPELIQLAGLSIQDDGSNDASSIAHVSSYLRAIGEIAGSVGVVSARMTLQNKARELGLDDGF